MVFCPFQMAQSERNRDHQFLLYNVDVNDELDDPDSEAI
jgi:hypothetical protein